MGNCGKYLVRNKAVKHSSPIRIALHDGNMTHYSTVDEITVEDKTHVRLKAYDGFKQIDSKSASYLEIFYDDKLLENFFTWKQLDDTITLAYFKLVINLVKLGYPIGETVKL